MNHTSSSQNHSGWTEKEWRQMRTKLERLSVDDLKKLALACDIRFEGGIDSLKDREQADVKEQIILVLDETEPALLQKEYTRLIKST